MSQTHCYNPSLAGPIRADRQFYLVPRGRSRRTAFLAEIMSRRIARSKGEPGSHVRERAAAFRQLVNQVLNQKLNNAEYELSAAGFCRMMPA
jgi:hypothetical protein